MVAVKRSCTQPPSPPCFHATSQQLIMTCLACAKFTSEGSKSSVGSRMPRTRPLPDQALVGTEAWLDSLDPEDSVAPTAIERNCARLAKPRTVVAEDLTFGRAGENA